MKRVAIYLRVSTSKQDTDNQRRELEAVAERSGWKVVKAYEDAGISGAKGRDQRPGLDAMMKAVNAKEFDMVASWSVDRLGRSLTDLLSILQSLHEKGVGLFLHQQGLDTSTTAGAEAPLAISIILESGSLHDDTKSLIARSARLASSGYSLAEEGRSDHERRGLGPNSGPNHPKRTIRTIREIATNRCKDYGSLRSGSRRY
jgi:hypothetical protein